VEGKAPNRILPILKKIGSGALSVLVLLCDFLASAKLNGYCKEIIEWLPPWRASSKLCFDS
jgi:hypothetical protein